MRLARSSVTASEKAIARLQAKLAMIDETLASPSYPSALSPAKLMKDRASVAAELEEAELAWLDAQERLERAEA